MEWREIKPGQWWHLFEDTPDDPTKPDKNGVLHPPDMVIHWSRFPTSYVHFYDYANGVFPGENDEEDCDYLHICEPKEFIKDLEAWIKTSKYIGEEYD